MRLRLASLALLLLALCRQSSAGMTWTVDTVTGTSTKSSEAYSKTTDDKKTAVATAVTKQITSTKVADKDAVPGLLGNTLLALGFTAAGIIDKLPEFFLKSLINGIQCEVEPTVAATIAALQDYDKDADKTDYAFDCAADANEEPKITIKKCLCEDNKPAIYCAALGIKTAIANEPGISKGDCRPKALTDLKNVAPKLGAEYDAKAFFEDKHENEFSGEELSISEAKPELYCEAIKPGVDTAMKKLYAADAFYWVTESVMYTALFGSVGQSLTQACEEDPFKSSSYGQCVCKKDTGYTFCLYKVLGDLFKTEGYLDCTSTPNKFVTNKKPKADKIKLVKPSPVVAPTPAPGPGNDPNATTTAKPDAAATSSLLLASLSVAAAMLLRH